MRRILAGTILLLAVTLTACGSDDKPDPTATPQPGATTQALDGSIATDGICQVTIPDDWVDDGTGRGQTLQGDRWMVFGGTIASDDAWSRAVDLVKTQYAKDSADVQETDTSVTITQASGRGYVYRERFTNRYCQFAVTTTADRSVEIVATWQQAATTLQPNQP
jgi:hypothetical protein